MIYDTSDIVRHWSSDIQSGVGDRIHSPASELGYIPALELGSGPALVLGCKIYLEYSPGLELGCKRTLPPGNKFKPEVWHKNNKALIKAGNLKGLLGYPTCKPVECISVILKIKDKEDLLNQFSRPMTEDEEQFGRIEERP